MSDMKKYCIGSRRKGTSDVQYEEGTLTALATSCLGGLLKIVIEGKIAGRLEVTGIRRRRRKRLKETRGYWKLTKGSTRSRLVEKSLWKKVWICSKADCGVQCNAPYGCTT